MCGWLRTVLRAVVAMVPTGGPPGAYQLHVAVLTSLGEDISLLGGRRQAVIVKRIAVAADAEAEVASVEIVVADAEAEEGVLARPMARQARQLLRHRAQVILREETPRSAVIGAKASLQMGRNGECHGLHLTSLSTRKMLCERISFALPADHGINLTVSMFQGLDAHQDTPVEVLHVVLLGFVK